MQILQSSLQQSTPSQGHTPHLSPSQVRHIASWLLAISLLAIVLLTVLFLLLRNTRRALFFARSRRASKRSSSSSPWHESGKRITTPIFLETIDPPPSTHETVDLDPKPDDPDSDPPLDPDSDDSPPHAR